MPHIRIDEGIKRGPKAKFEKPKLKTKTGLTVVKNPLSKLSIERRQEIATEVLDSYIQGAQIADIAHKYETSDVTIYALLLREHEQDWADIQRARALARFATSLHEIAVAPDALSLGRARELHKSAQWELERLLDRLYGQKNHVTIETVGDLGDKLRRARERTIDGECVVDNTNAAVHIPVLTV